MTFAGRRPNDAELAAHYKDYGTAWFDSPITRARYRDLLDAFEPYRVSNRIFDVGCGAGYFLQEARARGWEASGSEYGERALALCRAKGLDVVRAPMAFEAFEPAGFDVITAFEVVEHVTDPRQEAGLFARMLRPGGLLYCTTPNFGALSRRVLGASWSVIDYPEHLLYFTPATLRSWLSKFGFDPIRISTTGVSLTDLRSARAVAYHGGDESATSDDERLRVAIEGSQLLRVAKSSVNIALSAFGAGDTIKAWLRLRPDPST